MPLDFAILAKNGALAESVELSIDLHHELIGLARELKLSQVLRFRDYFEDVDIIPKELPALQKEIDSLQHSLRANNATAFLREFDSLLTLAIRKKLTLHAIAD